MASQQKPAKLKMKPAKKLLKSKTNTEEDEPKSSKKAEVAASEVSAEKSPETEQTKKSTAVKRKLKVKKATTANSAESSGPYAHPADSETKRQKRKLGSEENPSGQPKKSRKREDKQLSRKQRKLREKRGIIYIGHLPTGFMEPQLKAFFSQFGEVCRIRLFRSRKNGHSKGYAFVEFALREVAEIAAKSMDKYRMFGRTLVCNLTPKGEIKEHVFRNSHLKFKRINWQKIAAAKHNKPEDQMVSAQTIANSEKRLRAKQKKLEKLEIDFELPSLAKKPEERQQLKEWAQHERNTTKSNKKAKAKKAPGVDALKSKTKKA